jgi:beta-lactamase regulating signal transducer with metallopeptidase domain
MTPLLQTAGWTLINFLGVGTAIAGAASVLLRLTRRRSATARYAIACVSLAGMLAAPLVTARMIWIGTELASTANEVQGDAAGLKSRPTSRTAFSLVSVFDEHAVVAQGSRVAQGFSPASFLASIDRFLPTITISWLAGVILLLARMAGGWWHVRRLHRLALATASSRWQTSCRRLAYRLGLPAAAHVVESALVDVPTVVGWLRPAILLPIAAIASLSPSQVEAILAHELAHIRRHDYAVNVLQTIAETLLFYHPAVWWVSRRIRVEREHCCDDIAVAICGDPVSYAQALAELESWRTSSPSMAMAATGGSLLDRVRRILHVPITDEPRSPSWAVTLAL